MRPILRPGCHVLRRTAGELQVGLDPSGAVVLADGPAVRHSLELLARAAAVEEYADRDTLAQLTAAGLVIDSGTLTPLIPTGPVDPADPDHRLGRSSVPGPAVAALARTAGDDAANRLAARRALRVTVTGHPEPAPHLLADLTGLLAAAGLATSAGGEADVAVLVSVGEPHREDLDGWLRSGVPHLPVRLVEGHATVGPFVVPGQTACVRCVDAHLTDVDPCWPLLVEQYAARVARPRPDGVPEPVDPIVAAAALAWAARDLTSYAEGRRPSSWSATIRFEPELAAVETRTWLRHPGCCCTWD